MFDRRITAPVRRSATAAGGPAATALPSPVPLTWDLESLWPQPGTDAFAETFAAATGDLETLRETSESLPPATPENAAMWGAFVARLATVSETLESLSSFVGCWAAADAANETYQKYEARIAALSPMVTKVALAIEMALRDLTADDLDSLAEADETLQTNRFFLEQAAADGQLRLPRELEELESELAVDGLKAWSRLYDRVSGQLRITVMEAGELVEKSPGQVQFDQPSRTERENNFRASEKAWGEVEETCADALNHLSGARLTKYRRLGVDHLAKPLRLNRLQQATLDQMWDCVTSRKSFLRDYFAAKAKWLDLDELSWFDLSAPLPLRGAVAKLTYDDACRTVVETFDEFSPPLGRFAADAIADRWIEAEDRAGKRQGGFCTDLAKQEQSRIFMTYTGTPDSMSTLAHELGHAYHTFVLRGQPPLLQGYPMNLAETASTFAEAVMGARRLEDAQSDAQRLGVLDGLCGDAVAYLMNIHARYLFEDRFHQRRVDGELSADELSELMLAAQKEAFLDGLADDGYYPRFWVSKLHFYIAGWPFYNFPYTFGYLLSQGLYALGQQQPAEEFADNFRRFLVLTGCRETEDAVRESFGHDLSEPTFWNLALDGIEARVRDFVAASEASL